MPDSSQAGSFLGSSLEPHLREACGGRLSEVRWFRSDWQRGGASTGLARLETDAGAVDVVVKLPVGPVEHRWSTLLGIDGTGPTPRVYHANTALNGYDLGWLVMERLPWPPLAAALDAGALRSILAAACVMHKRALAACPPGQAPVDPDWARAVEQSREVARRGVIAEAQKWNSVLKDVHRHLDVLTRHWSARAINSWCHGDLHPGNALRREPGTDHCVLIDLALVHAGHWVEDAIYLERVHWARPEGTFGVNLVSTLAAHRRQVGLPVDDDYARLGATRRVLMAACAPALLEREGSAKYLHASLGVLQQWLPHAAH